MPQRTDDTKPVYGPSPLEPLAKLFNTMRAVSKVIFDKTVRSPAFLPAPSEPLDAKPK